MALVATLGAALGATFISQAAAAAVFPPVFEMLNQPSDFLLKFDTPITPNPDTAPARLIASSNDPFSETKYATLMGEIDPCAVISAHTHPRSTEIDFVMEGEIMFQAFLETGETVITNVKPGEGGIIPEGTLHVTSNPGCTPTKAIIQFDHPVPGTVFAGPALSQLPEAYLQEAFLGPFPEPQPPFFLNQACLERCGLSGRRSGGRAGGYGN